VETTQIKMKYSITFFFLANFICATCYSQDVASRILEIKKMYAEVIKLSKPNISKQCKKGKKTFYEGDFEIGTIEEGRSRVEQTAERCHISKEYTIYKAKFSGHEWYSDIIYYLKNNKIFFAYLSAGAESCIYEYRVYYDLNENIIKILKKSNDCDVYSPLKSSEIKDKAEIKRIYDNINSSFYYGVLRMVK
jgi:hypothetical protein